MANWIGDTLDALLNEEEPPVGYSLLQGINQAICHLRVDGQEPMVVVIHPDDADLIRKRYGVFPAEKESPIYFGVEVRVDGYAIKGEPKVMPKPRQRPLVPFRYD